MTKSFIITIDTEGDNLWGRPKNNEITTLNARFLNRFQDLCNRFNFKPVYLTNYEMAKSPDFIAFGEKNVAKNNCEIGMHLHAWNNPPIYRNLGEKDGDLTYITDYPKDIIKEKIEVLGSALTKKFGEIKSHRAGRWGLNSIYAKALYNWGIRIDCSVTPYVSWQNYKGYQNGNNGEDFRKFPVQPYFMNMDKLYQKGDTNFLQVPVTIRSKRNLSATSKKLALLNNHNVIKKVSNKLFGTIPNSNWQWMRPMRGNLKNLLILSEKIKNENETTYMEFMMHSSELMAGGSPYFRTNEDIETLYDDLEKLFSTIAKNFEGKTLKEFYSDFIKKSIPNKVL